MLQTGELSVQARPTRNESDRSHQAGTDGLKRRLERNQEIQFDPEAMRQGMYRPFMKQHVSFDRQLV